MRTREGGELDRLVEIKRVADPYLVGVDQADDVAGKCLVDRGAFLTEHLVRVLRGEWLAGAPVGEDHAAFESARAHAQERETIAVRRVHVGLNLEHETAEGCIERAGGAVDVEPGRR